MKRARIVHLHAVAKERPAGYLEACLRAGQPSPDGQWILFSDEAHRALRQQYNPRLAAIKSTAPVSSHRGLGDLVHQIAGPIGRAIGWPCLKGDGTTDLKPGSPCERARRTLNKFGRRGAPPSRLNYGRVERRETLNT